MGNEIDDFTNHVNVRVNGLTHLRDYEYTMDPVLD
jgi:hypothetical protein